MARNTWTELENKKPNYKHLKVENYGLLKPKQNKLVQDISKAHVESFNYMINEGLGKSVSYIQPLDMEIPSGERLKIVIKDCTIGVPVIHKDNVHANNLKVFPSECRSRGVTYRGKLNISLTWSVDGLVQETIDKVVGEVPVMVKSVICNLNKLTPTQLVKHGEEAEEFGGYFIINGNERIVRLLIIQRRNYPLAMVRPGWKNRGQNFTEYGVSIRCVRSDQSGSNMVLHYLSDGTIDVMVSFSKEIFLIPLMYILKALCDKTDQEIFNEIMKGNEDNSFYQGCITSMLRELQNSGCYSQAEIKNHLGENFRVKTFLPDWYSNTEVADFILKECVCVHLENNIDKFNLMVFMTKKLFAATKGDCALESPDNPMNHEVVLPGHMYAILIKEKLESWLLSVKIYLDKKIKKSTKSIKLTSSFVTDALNHAMDLSRPIQYVFATGNFVSKSGSGLTQFTGLTVVADKLNFWRYLSHFRCIHRGAFFTEMRTTSARKLLPEAWGFMCPVHTPDGTPCGLLNHLTAMCQVVSKQASIDTIPSLLNSLGMISCSAPLPFAASSCYHVLLDGRILGWIPMDLAEDFVKNLRTLKASSECKVPYMMEICFIPFTGAPSQYPGIFLFSTPARMMRPVRNFQTDSVEYVGTMEQVYLNICVTQKEAHEGLTTHQELCQTSMLSILANMIPYPDFNQSPRNMYECQMGKQTMGTPCHAFKYRSDNKLYRIQTPHSPLVRSAIYDTYQMDDYPLGTNAIVAVISYTGYDMEDAMMLNKASLERGFKHGSIYKSEMVDLTKMHDRDGQAKFQFARKVDEENPDVSDFIDSDGLPYVGTRLTDGDPMYSVMNSDTGKVKCHKYSSHETAYVIDVKILGSDTGAEILQKICITLWIPRNPSIGDKFASRHGQKGVCSLYMPMEDMPFTESGMVPDIIFNPHGFPSRMTIGMIIESMAGKSAAIHGLCHDSKPFQYSENETAGDYFGNLLKKAGYNYHGTERMYSGVDGEEMVADIFFGIVYYQRLRHMVADKFQMRTTGIVDQVTRQPVKGRKRGGGIRFGEMERDSFISHGSSFLLQDRLYNCSDRSMAYVCMACKSLVSVLYEKPPDDTKDVRSDWTCGFCDSKNDVGLVSVPYVFRYLASELMSTNICLKINVQ